MKTNSLRIGNIVSHKGNAIVITSIDTMSVTNKDAEDIDSEELEPVTSNKKWLKKAGFKSATGMSGNRFYSKYIDGIEFMYDNSLTISFNTDAINLGEKKLHEIQNIVHALTGSELEIKD